MQSTLGRVINRIYYSLTFCKYPQILVKYNIFKSLFQLVEMRRIIINQKLQSVTNVGCRGFQQVRFISTHQENKVFFEGAPPVNG